VPIHFDGLINSPDSSAVKPGTTTGIGSNAAGDAASDFEFRRVFISLVGHVFKDFEYHIDYDIAGSNFQDVWIAYADPIGGTIYGGQHKPWRSLDEIASNNNTVFLERNFASATDGGSGGIYGGIDYTNGVYYAINKTAFLPSDNVWGGASIYSLHKQAGGNEVRTQGIGYNARLAYAPIVDKDVWVHLGASFSSDHPDGNGSSTVAGTCTTTTTTTTTTTPSTGTATSTSTSSSATTCSVNTGAFSALTPKFYYEGRTGTTVSLASYGVAATGNPHADFIAAELAAAYGPVYFQGEYVDAGYHQHGVIDNSVDTFSATLAYAVTGETRPYDKKAATYGAIKPANKYGAVEVSVRYDDARNDKHGGYYHGASESGVAFASSTATTTATSATKDSVSTITAGVNYYVNSAVRFVFDYTHGEAKFGNAGKDSPDAFGLRAQLVF